MLALKKFAIGEYIKVKKLGKSEGRLGRIKISKYTRAGAHIYVVLILPPNDPIGYDRTLYAKEMLKINA